MSTTNANFENLGIAPKILEILRRLKFTTPTPIQHQSIPAAVAGKDIMGIAQTGTGKTLAFGLPLIQRLAQSPGRDKGLIIVPTRELALQVSESLKKIGLMLGLRSAVLIGGESMYRQLLALRKDPHLLIATPGRLIDHLSSDGALLNNVRMLVLDEADRTLDMGFAPQIKKIMEKIPKERQVMLFSVTMPNQIITLAKAYMTLPLRVEVAPSGTVLELVSQELFFVEREDKFSLLQTLLGEHTGSVLVFSRTKYGAKRIAQAIRTRGFTAAEIHSNRSLHQRIEALEGFKIGKYRILVATDIAARGIHVNGIQVVINFDLPANAEDYIHRIGRTGRAGTSGHAISFATPDQRRDIRDIEKLIRMSLPISRTPDIPKNQALPSIPNEPRHPNSVRQVKRDGLPKHTFGKRPRFHKNNTDNR